MEEKQAMALQQFGLDLNRVVKKDGRYWLTAEQLGTALGYSVPRESVTKLINRHREELQPFIAGVNLTSPCSPNDGRGGGLQETTIIDTDGQYMIALLANTPKAARFRAFVVNMLRALERQEFIHISQVAEWKAELQELRIAQYLSRCKVVNLRKYKNFCRYRDMGLSLRETGLLLQVGERTIERLWRLRKTGNPQLVQRGAA